VNGFVDDECRYKNGVLLRNVDRIARVKPRDNINNVTSIFSSMDSNTERLLGAW
jgi:hypothetical protein